MSVVRLGDFRLGEILGRGGMGVVFHAVHEPTGFPVAIKGITRAAARDGDVRAALESEVRAVASLDHPAIVSVLEHGVVDRAAAAASGGALGAGSPWLAMELATGGSLQPWAHASRPPLSWAELRALLLRLLDALSHAHARGVLHLDLKPANILLGGEGDARPGLKLVDFGLARSIEPDPRETAETDRNDAAGTPLYMAPEQFEGLGREFGPWTDLYALGGVAWSLATGAPSVAGDDIFALAFAHMRGDRRRFEPRAPVPTEFVDWLQDLLARRPEQRYRCAADAALALAALPDPPEGGFRPALEPTLEWGGGTTTLGSLYVSQPTLPPRAGGAFVPRTGRFPTPPVPGDWRVEERPRPLPQLVGAGLALFGLREQPVVGRAEERDLLWAALRQVHAQGQPRLVLLKGGAGSGKSRLASWLCRRAQEVGAAAPLRATHSPTLGADDGLGPMLARAFSCVGLEHGEVADRLASALPSSLPIDALAEIIAPSAEPVSVFETPQQRWVVVAAALRELASDRPLVLWLDDLQWGLQATRFAAWLARTDLGVLVVGTWRDDDDVQEEARRLLDELAVLDAADTVDVGPLGPKHGLALVHALLDLEPVLARDVAERTAGNPLFSVQLVGDWVQRGVLESTARGFRLRSGAADGLPPSLAAVWQRRVDRLLEGRSDAEVHALELAATLGPTVHSGEWTALCGRCGADPWGTLLDALLAAGLAHPSDRGPRGSWSFAHGLLREAIEGRSEELGRRASNHRACASMLRERGAGPARLGPHLLAGAAWSEAASALLEAATRHQAASDFPQARAALSGWLRAQELAELPDSDPGWRAGLLALASVERASGFLERAEHFAERALVGAQARGDALGEALVAAELGRIRMNQGEYDQAVDLVEGAMAVLDGTEEVVACSDALRTLAIVHMARGHWEPAVAAFARALSKFEGVGATIKAGFCRVGLAQIARHQGRLGDAAEQLRTAQESFAAIGYRMGSAECANGLGELSRLSGDLNSAEAAYRRALALYQELGSIDVPVAQANLGLIQSARGDWAGARTSLDAARRTLALEKRRDLEAACCAALMAPAAAARDAEAFDRYLGRALDLIDRTGFVYSDVAQEAERAGQLWTERGDQRRARQAYQLALAQWEGLQRQEDAARVRSKLEG